MTDRDLQQHVQNALDWEPSINVAVTDGKVILSGNVHSSFERDERGARRGLRQGSKRSRTISPSFRDRSRW